MINDLSFIISSPFFIAYVAIDNKHNLQRTTIWKVILVLFILINLFDSNKCNYYIAIAISTLITIGFNMHCSKRFSAQLPWFALIIIVYRNIIFNDKNTFVNSFN